MTPEIGSRWTVDANDPPRVVFEVVCELRPDWWTLVVLEDTREDHHTVGYRFTVETEWFTRRARRV